MAGPSWLAGLLAAAMIATAAYCAVRLAVAWRRRRPTAHDVDATHVAIIFVTQQNDPDVMAAALRSGAKAYVLKVDANRELLPAVEAVLQGKNFISSGVTRRP